LSVFYRDVEERMELLTCQCHIKVQPRVQCSAVQCWLFQLYSVPNCCASS